MEDRLVINIVDTLHDFTATQRIQREVSGYTSKLIDMYIQQKHPTIRPRIRELMDLAGTIEERCETYLSNKNKRFIKFSDVLNPPNLNGPPPTIDNYIVYTGEEDHKDYKPVLIVEYDDIPKFQEWMNMVLPAHQLFTLDVNVLGEKFFCKVAGKKVIKTVATVYDRNYVNTVDAGCIDGVNDDIGLVVLSSDDHELLRLSQVSINPNGTTVNWRIDNGAVFTIDVKKLVKENNNPKNLKLFANGIMHVLNVQPAAQQFDGGTRVKATTNRRHTRGKTRQLKTKHKKPSGRDRKQVRESHAVVRENVSDVIENLYGLPKAWIDQHYVPYTLCLMDFKRIGDLMQVKVARTINNCYVSNDIVSCLMSAYSYNNLTIRTAKQSANLGKRYITLYNIPSRGYHDAKEKYEAELLKKYKSYITKCVSVQSHFKNKELNRVRQVLEGFWIKISSWFTAEKSGKLINIHQTIIALTQQMRHLRSTLYKKRHSQYKLEGKLTRAITASRIYNITHKSILVISEVINEALICIHWLQNIANCTNYGEVDDYNHWSEYEAFIVREKLPPMETFLIHNADIISEELLSNNIEVICRYVEGVNNLLARISEQGIITQTSDLINKYQFSFAETSELFSFPSKNVKDIYNAYVKSAKLNASTYFVSLDDNINIVCEVGYVTENIVNLDEEYEALKYFNETRMQSLGIQDIDIHGGGKLPSTMKPTNGPLPVFTHVTAPRFVPQGTQVASTTILPKIVSPKLQPITARKPSPLQVDPPSPPSSSDDDDDIDDLDIGTIDFIDLYLERLVEDIEEEPDAIEKQKLITLLFQVIFLRSAMRWSLPILSYHPVGL